VAPRYTANTMCGSFQELESRLQDELGTKFFFQLSPEKRAYFDDPRAGWEEVVAKFPECTSDVEEMRRCFALSR